MLTRETDKKKIQSTYSLHEVWLWAGLLANKHNSNWRAPAYPGYGSINAVELLLAFLQVRINQQLVVISFPVRSVLARHA